MIKWILRIFGIKIDIEKKYADILLKYKELLEKQNSYTVLKPFDRGDREFIRKISTVQEMEEMKFMLFDLKQKYIEAMIEGDSTGNLDVQKSFYILKGISIVERNLNEYKNQWNQIVNMESQNAEI